MSTRRSRTTSSRSTSTKGGQIVWKYEPKQDPNVIPVMCCDTVNRGVAYADGKIFLHQADTTLVALDAKTGEEALVGVNGDPQGRDQHRDRWSGEGQGDRRYLRR
jgi:glucose dehydrogenase